MERAKRRSNRSQGKVTFRTCASCTKMRAGWEGTDILNQRKEEETRRPGEGTDINGTSDERKKEEKLKKGEGG